tara:strand:- start:73 stop:423 length:351 start_codon:yes stop_codon:yes gene_type:complete
MPHRIIFCAAISAVISAPVYAQGRWCDVMVPSMSRFDALIEISSVSDGDYEATVSHEDGSKSNAPLVKSGSKFTKENAFGEYYVVRENGDLALYDAEGFIRVAKLARPDAKPGNCR